MASPWSIWVRFTTARIAAFCWPWPVPVSSKSSRPVASICAGAAWSAVRRCRLPCSTRIKTSSPSTSKPRAVASCCSRWCAEVMWWWRTSPPVRWSAWAWATSKCARSTRASCTAQVRAMAAAAPTKTTRPWTSRCRPWPASWTSPVFRTGLPSSLARPCVIFLVASICMAAS